MLGCHIAREVKVRLQKGLRFRFRELQKLTTMLQQDKIKYLDQYLFLNFT